MSFLTYLPICSCLAFSILKDPHFFAWLDDKGVLLNTDRGHGLTEDGSVQNSLIVKLFMDVEQALTSGGTDVKLETPEEVSTPHSC